jgi:uncharacterized protein with HEPN domain
MKRVYTDYLQDILDAALKAEQFVAGITFEEFEKNDEKVFAVAHALEIIGEAARSVPEEKRAQYADVPWRSITGMRDKLIHGYFTVDLSRVWETVKSDLPSLREAVSKILTETKTNPEE